MHDWIEYFSISVFAFGRVNGYYRWMSEHAILNTECVLYRFITMSQDRVQEFKKNMSLISVFPLLACLTIRKFRGGE